MTRRSPLKPAQVSSLFHLYPHQLLVSVKRIKLKGEFWGTEIKRPDRKDHLRSQHRSSSPRRTCGVKTTFSSQAFALQTEDPTQSRSHWFSKFQAGSSLASTGKGWRILSSSLPIRRRKLLCSPSFSIKSSNFPNRCEVPQSHNPTKKSILLWIFQEQKERKVLFREWSTCYSQLDSSKRGLSAHPELSNCSICTRRQLKDMSRLLPSPEKVGFVNLLCFSSSCGTHVGRSTLASLSRFSITAMKNCNLPLQGQNLLISPTRSKNCQVPWDKHHSVKRCELKVSLH